MRSAARCLSFVLCLLFLQGCVTSKGDVTGKGVSLSNTPRQIMADDISFDAATGEITYTIPEDAFVRIRLGLTNGGPMLTHLLDWDLRRQGRNGEKWSGRVGKSPIDYRSRKDLMITVIAYATASEDDLTMHPYLQPSPAFEILFPDSVKREGGYPVLTGKSRIRIMVPSETMRWLSDLRYEIALYFDDLFIYEEEEGLNPFTFFLDTAQYNDGLHRINVNIICSSGQAGALTKIIKIQNQPQDQ